jgi:Sigma-70, region 4
VTFGFDAAFDLLDGHQRYVAQLHYVENHSYLDIAGRLGIAEGTVKSHNHRATKKLRKYLAPLASGLTVLLVIAFNYIDHIDDLLQSFSLGQAPPPHAEPADAILPSSSVDLAITITFFVVLVLLRLRSKRRYKRRSHGV